jgi:putative ATP-binding cassette transporter
MRPKIVFLDEATTAMDSGIEQMIYTTLPNVVEQYVSTGSHAELSKYHEHSIQLIGDGTWHYE